MIDRASPPAWTRRRALVWVGVLGLLGGIGRLLAAGPFGAVGKTLLFVVFITVFGLYGVWELRQDARARRAP